MPGTGALNIVIPAKAGIHCPGVAGGADIALYVCAPVRRVALSRPVFSESESTACPAL